MKLVLHWLVTACLCGVLPLAAHAQWQWTDKNGKTVFSDTAPPPEVPEKNIQRRGNAPAPRPNPNVVVLNPGADAADTKPAGSEAKAGVDKDLEEKIKKAEEAEKAKKAAEEQKIAQAKAENCNRARQAKATYDSGIRVARLNAQGEREIIDDNMRAEEQKRLQSVIASDCRQ